MNILFVLYGDFTSNSANPLTLYARELSRLGHKCTIAVPYNREKGSRKTSLNDGQFSIVMPWLIPNRFFPMAVRLM